MSAETIGSALGEKRRALGLEKGQAADKIGMSRTTYSSYEQDAQRPSVDVFPALASFLEISIEELLVLYGATCVAAMRPSLDRLLATQVDGSIEVNSTEEIQPVSENLRSKVTESSDERLANSVEMPETTLPIEVEAETYTINSPVVVDSTDSLDSRSCGGAEAIQDPVGLREFEVTPWSTQHDDAPSSAEQPKLDRATMFESSPMVIESPVLDDRAKDVDRKKKKKKKKKKN
jgi:transcriptional regulator with XRE-family HTH domain